MKKIYSIILALVMIFSLTTPVFATDTSRPTTQHVGGTTLVGEFADRIEVDFTETYFFKANIMNPGDRWESIITLKNNSDEDMEISLVEIRNMLDDSLLFDALDLEFYIGQELIYKGPYNATEKPVFNWIDFPKNSVYELYIYTIFPGECGNEYQGKKFEANWIFEVRCDEKQISEIPNEEIDTGDDTKIGMYGYIFLGSAATLAVLLLLTGKKKKEDDENEKK